MQEIVSFNEGLASPKDAESFISWGADEELYGKLMLAEGRKFDLLVAELAKLKGADRLEQLVRAGWFLTNDDKTYLRAEMFVLRDGVRTTCSDWFLNLDLANCAVRVNKQSKMLYTKLTPKLVELTDEDELI